MAYKDMDKLQLEEIRAGLVSRGYAPYWPELSDWAREWKNYTCERCGNRAHQVHHRDGNPSNNILSNLAVLCAKCASVYHVVMEAGHPETKESKVVKNYNCEGCGRPIAHRGYCLVCNIRHKIARGEYDN